MAYQAIGKHAVVIGAGMGGLTAAGALAKHFEQVTVLERDRLPRDAAHRAGTPQARHLHGLLAGGVQALARLFPGFDDDLLRAGAIPLRGGLDVRLERPGFDPFPARDLGMLTFSASRPAIEFCLRQRLAQHANVVLRDGCRVLAIEATPDGAAVSGVRFQSDGSADETVRADLVVDASGRAVFTLDLLRATGRPAPEETTIGVDIGYASCIFDIPGDAPKDWKGVMTFPRAPQSSRGALLLPLEGGRWMVSLGGRGDDKPPGDDAGFLDYAKNLRTPTIYNAIRGAKRVGEVARYAFAQSVHRHFERLGSMPRGVLPIADSICSFNPVYGQGMSVAAQEACVLDRLLGRLQGQSDPLAGLASAFFEETKTLLDTPWAMAAIPDFVFPATVGQRPPDLARTLKFGAALTRLAARKPDVHKVMVEVQHLLKPRSVYRSPMLMARVMLEMVRS